MLVNQSSQFIPKEVKGAVDGAAGHLAQTALTF